MQNNLAHLGIIGLTLFRPHTKPYWEFFPFPYRFRSFPVPKASYPYDILTWKWRLQSEVRFRQTGRLPLPFVSFCFSWLQTFQRLNNAPFFARKSRKDLTEEEISFVWNAFKGLCLSSCYFWGLQMFFNTRPRHPTLPTSRKQHFLHSSPSFSHQNSFGVSGKISLVLDLPAFTRGTFFWVHEQLEAFSFSPTEKTRGGISFRPEKDEFWDGLIENQVILKERVLWRGLWKGWKSDTWKITFEYSSHMEFLLIERYVAFVGAADYHGFTYIYVNPL